MKLNWEMSNVPSDNIRALQKGLPTFPPSNNGKLYKKRESSRRADLDEIHSKEHCIALVLLKEERDEGDEAISIGSEFLLFKEGMPCSLPLSSTAFHFPLNEAFLFPEE